MRPRFFALMTVLLLSPLAGAANSCMSLFQPRATAFDAWNKINQDSGYFFLTPAQSDLFTQSYSLEQKRMIRHVLNRIKFSLGLRYDRNLSLKEALEKVDLRRIHDPSEIEAMVSEFSLALYGHPHTVDRFLLMSNLVRVQGTARRVMGEEILRKGLLDVWHNLPDKQRAGLVKRSRLILGKVWNWRPLVALGQLPFPQLPKQRLPFELVEKVMLNGYDAHAMEVQAYFKAPNAREAYSTFRRLFLPTLMGTLLLTQIQVAHQQIQLEIESSEKELDQFKDSLKSLETGVIEYANAQREAIFNDAYQEALIEFQAKWGEPPTPEEEQILREKIRRSLGLEPSPVY